MKDNVIKIIDSFGNTKSYDIMMTFDSENTKKSYVVYTNYEINKEGKIIVYASTYEEINNNLRLGNVDTPEESEFINRFLEEQHAEINYSLKSENE